MFSNIITIARRSIQQLARDRRTIALIIIVPLVIASLIGVSIPNKTALDQTLPAMLILFFSFLRERSQGTRERLMASPVSSVDIIGGYLLGFLFFAIIQTLVLFFYTVYVIKVDSQGALWQILLFQVLIGILAVCLGIFISAFARNEFQMVQFIPLIIVPQVFICGMLFPVNTLPDYLQWIAKFLPLTYGVDGVRALMLQGRGLLDIGKEIGVLAGYAVVLMGLAAISLRRGHSA